LKTILFDFGNVVGFFDHGRTLEKLRPYSPLTPKQMYDLVYMGPLEDQVERGVLTPPEFLREAHKLWQLNCGIDFLAQAVGDIFTPNPEVCELIPRLKPHYRLVLGSNTNALHAERFLTQFADVLSHFDSLVLSHEVRARKPNPEFFRHCHDRANALPAECVFVDDLAANVEGARRAGFHGIVYKPHDHLGQQLRALGIAW
jgi:putative hydrolase of the HAD superfamily